MDVMKADSGEIYLDDQPFVRSGFSIGYLPKKGDYILKRQS